MATATALTNHGTLVSVPDRAARAPQLPAGLEPRRAPRPVRARSLRLRPRLPTAVGHCVFIRRSALELVGDFDLAFTPGYGEEVDFSQRCLQSGLSHVLADDVLVLHHGGGSFSRNGGAQPRPGRARAHARRPLSVLPRGGAQAIEDEGTGRWRARWAAARRALRGLSVAIDARMLAGPTTGTQLHVLELIARAGPDRRGPDDRDRARPDEPLGVARAATRCRTSRLADPSAGGGLRRDRRADVVHRPYQVDNEDDLAFLAGWASGWWSPTRT